MILGKITNTLTDIPCNITCFRISNPNHEVIFAMSYQDHLDPQSQRFHHNWTRPKRQKSQVNGHTEMSQNNIILRSNAKAHRW
jgi:hypothetical protein